MLNGAKNQPPIDITEEEEKEKGEGEENTSHTISLFWQVRAEPHKGKWGVGRQVAKFSEESRNSMEVDETETRTETHISIRGRWGGA